jgi:hypothetical protein
MIFCSRHASGKLSHACRVAIQAEPIIYTIKLREDATCILFAGARYHLVTAFGAVPLLLKIKRRVGRDRIEDDNKLILDANLGGGDWCPKRCGRQRRCRI